MDRKSFLATLKRTLWWRLPPEELSTVLEDYNEYFDSGMAEGKSETELCKQFGSPAKIATDIANERGSKYHSIALASMVLCAGLLLIAIILFLNPYWLSNMQISSYMVYFEIFILSLGSLLLAKKTMGTVQSKQVSRTVGTVGTIVTLLGVSAYIGFSAFTYNIFIGDRLRWLLERIKPEHLGPTIIYVLIILAVATTVLWIITIIQSASLHRRQLLLIPAYAMTLSLLVSLIFLLGQLSDPDCFIPAVVQGAQLSLLQLLPIILVFIPRKRRES